VFLEVPLISGFSRDKAVINPEYIADTVPTVAMHGNSRVLGYDGLPQAIDLAVERITSVTEPTFTHIYWGNIDSTAHGVGTSHPDTVEQVKLFDAQMRRLR
jgi:hypothetical protein